MSQTLSTPWIQTSLPGSYTNVQVVSNAIGLGTTGVVLCIGEASSGPSYSQDTIKTAYFKPNQLSDAINKFGSGNLVEAMRALTAPSADPNINGAPNAIFLIKTNTGTVATSLVGPFTFTVTSANATVGAVYTNNGQSFTVLNTIASGTTLVVSGTGAPTASGTLTKASGTGDATITFSANTNYGLFTSANYGVAQNKYKYQFTSAQAEVAPAITSSAITVGSYAGGSFTLRYNGGAGHILTLASSTTLSTLVTNMNSALTGAGLPITATAGTVLNTIVLTVNADPLAYGEGYAKSVELIDSTPTNLAALGLTAGIYNSSVLPAIYVNVARPDINLSSSVEVFAQIGLEIGYQGTTATMTINGTTLTTSVAGGSGANLSITLANYTTVSDLVAYINTQTGYTAIANTPAVQLAPSALDQVTAIGICSTAASLTPGQVYISLNNFEDGIGTIPQVVFTNTALAGLPAPTAGYAFLAGGTLGGTSSADVVNALAACASLNVNFVVPLFSEDATKDIALGLTSSSSTYTIASINAATKSSCIAQSTPKLKKNRIAMCSIWDTYANAKAQAQTLANYRCTLTFQQVQNVSATGNCTFMPWMGATIAAGMQAAGFYQSIVNKIPNMISFVNPTGFDDASPANQEDAIDNGLLVLQGGNQITWTSDQTTYGYDTNFIYNSLQGVSLSDIAALTLAANLQSKFVGQSLADTSAGSVKTYIQGMMADFLRLKITANSSDAPAGYKDLTVQINAPTIYVSLQIKLSTSVYFLAINLEISSISQTA